MNGRRSLGSASAQAKRSIGTRLTTERPRPERIRQARNAGWLAVGTVCFGAFMGQLDASIVTLTYSPLEHAFGVRAAAVQWVSLSYLLTLVVLLVPVGRLSDAHGRKLMYLYGFAVFTAASAACAVAPTLTVLIGCRVLQAVGAAMLQANSVALVTSSAPPGRMRAALGVQAAAQALGLALGPVVGGLSVDRFGWSSVFWVNVPIGVIALAAGQILLPRTRAFTPISGFDGIGLALLTMSGISLLLGLSAVSGIPITSTGTAALLIVAIVAGWLFIRRQSRTVSPLVELTVLHAPGVARGLAGAMCGYLVLFGPLVAVPAILAGRSSGQIGAVLSALPAGFAVAALADRAVPTGWADTRRGLAGAVITAGALTALLAAPKSPGVLALLLFVLGTGLGIYTPANNTTVMAAIPARSAGTGGSLVSMARGLGTALGVALVTLAMHVGRHSNGALTQARAAFGILLIAALVLLSLTAMRTGRPGQAPHQAGRIRLGRPAVEEPTYSDEWFLTGVGSDVEQRRWAAKYHRRLAPDAADGVVVPVIRSGHVRFRQGGAAANLRAASEWLDANPCWRLDSLRYEYAGPAELADVDDDEGPCAELWLLVEHAEQEA
ncbi:MFS transporter [Catenulispora subtropica]|uniref:Major facilitator superfamily (MFS) profile domain-containing protein n=1 Tax=Catenulispora subtropica TaxID=450798 RepID=A0ABP5EKU8_9ACTN